MVCTIPCLVPVLRLVRAEILQQDQHDRHKSRHLPIELRGDEEELSLRGYSPEEATSRYIEEFDYLYNIGFFSKSIILFGSETTY